MIRSQTQSDVSPVRTAMIGCGGMARHHLLHILRYPETTSIRVVCEPAPHNYEQFCVLFHDAGFEPPPNEPDLEQLLTKYADELDAAFIVTPHVFHYQQASACLEAGLDVLLEKPMVMTAAEARRLIDVRDRTGRLLVVGFNGSLSPQIRAATQMLRDNELGRLLNIHAVVWQSWRTYTVDTWRQVPELSGGGFLFDTGAHLLNTVADLADQDFTEVAAQLDNQGTQVDITGVVMGRLTSGALVSLGACGDTLQSCASDVRIFCTNGIIRTGVWGERLEVQRQGDSDLIPVDLGPSRGTWDQFLAVRRGQMANPCPPEVGLRMSLLWDMVRLSASQGGRPVTITDLG